MRDEPRKRATKFGRPSLMKLRSISNPPLLRRSAINRAQFSSWPGGLTESGRNEVLLG